MKEWLRRALRTFIQAAAGYAAANLVGLLAGVDWADGDALKVVLVGLAGSMVAAGIAAVMNMSPPPYLFEIEGEENEDEETEVLE